jgi:adenosylcobyric acid synthase
MLGATIEDPAAVESSTRVTTGLNLLPIVTRFGPEKRTTQLRARIASPSLLSGGLATGLEISGYEIHMGRIERVAEAAAPFQIIARNGVILGADDARDRKTPDILDGAISENGAVIGTMLHGIFENDALRAALISGLARRKGIDVSSGPRVATRDEEYDRLAETVRSNVDWEAIERIAGLR